MAGLILSTVTYLASETLFAAPYAQDYDMIQMQMPNIRSTGYRQCKIGVMDTIADPDIQFDAQGISNYYHEYRQAIDRTIIPGSRGEALLQERYDAIRRDGKDKRYDCIIGLSGGIDSTYLCLQAARQGLRPLLVHCDNSWNSERAVHNMERTVRSLGFDLHTHLINWREFRDMELAYLRASVVDIDILTDHAYVAVLYRLARKWKIRHVLSGVNMVSEHVLPPSWRFNSDDAVNIRDILRRHGNIDLRTMRTFPVQRYLDKAYCHHFLGIRFTYPFNFGSYDVTKAREEVARELGWQPFDGKHYDSIWTRFYQGYLLPVKFGIDKRKAHLSNLIFSGQLTRESALAQLRKPPYPPDLLRQDMDLFLRKMSLSQAELEAIMALPRQEHSSFEQQKSIAERMPLAAPLLNWMRKGSGGAGAASAVTGVALSQMELLLGTAASI